MLRGGTRFKQSPNQNLTSNYVLNEIKETVVLELRKTQANFEEQLIEKINKLLAEQFLALKNEFLEKINMVTTKIQQLEVTLMTKADTYKDAITKNLSLNTISIKAGHKTKTQSQMKAKPVVQNEKPSTSLADSVPDADRTMQKSRSISALAVGDPDSDNLDKDGWVEKGTNLLELFEEDSECEEPELVQVYLRLKPCNIPSNLYEIKSDRCLITSLDTATVGHGRRTQHNVSKMYSFTHIFGPEANQKELFERVVMDNLKKLPEGNSFTLLTYGASGSGKTFTLMGTVAAPGLVPRSLEYVFRVVDAAQRPVYKPADNGAEKLSKAAQDHEMQFVKQMRHVSAPLRDKYRRMSVQLRNDLTTSDMELPRKTKYYVWVSFVEIYNEGIYDLLSTSDRSSASKLVIREDSSGNVYVKGATQVFVRTGEEAYDVMAAGKHNLQVAATGVNAHSSRSHCIFTITMLTQTDVGCRVSSVRLCDLAGCERVRRTQNAGARLAESRAINSSLHVLERCLRTLRRRQRAGRDALVPYRESKLTRLLGAGLSGARGEAVSVVVTITPAPECAHETRHVLQLAAVARDIQVNNTVSEYSSLETTHQDTIIAHNPDVLKLRADNERLHFELIQAHARNKELLAAMEERQAETANTMQELVDEAKDLTRQYYEAQIQSLRDEMEEMKEEYEARLCKLASQAPASIEGTPTRALQNKISQLMREIAILEEKLSAEELARARAEEELQHLRACIEERDEKDYDDAQKQNEEVMSVTDSEDDSHEEEEDPFSESLEPTFKKEDINRSRLMRQSLANVNRSTNDDSKVDDTGTDYVIVDINNQTIEKINDTVSLENSGDTLKDIDVINEKTYTGEVEDNVTCEENDKEIDEGLGELSREVDCVKVDKSFKNEEVNTFNSSNRGTYFINNTETVLSSSDAVEEKSKMQTLLRGTYFVRKSQDDSKSENSTQEQENNFSVGQCEVKEKYESTKQKEDIKTNTNVPLAMSDTLVNKILNSLESKSSAHNSNTSLAQFEQLEMAANDFDDEPKRKTFDALTNIKTLKEKRIFFCDNIPEEPSKDFLNIESNKEKKVFFDNLDVNVDNENKRVSGIKNIVYLKNDDVRSPSIVKEETACDFKLSTMKKLFGESLTRQADPISVIQKANILINKSSDSVDVFEGYDSPQIEIAPKSEQDDVENLQKFFKNTVLTDELTKIDVKCMITPEKQVEKEIQTVTKPSKREQDDVENIRKSIENIVLSNELAETCVKSAIKSEKPVEKEIQAVPKPTKDNTFHEEANAKIDNTLEEFETIYKDISEPRATQFDLLVGQDVNITDSNKDTTTEAKESVETKYNLRKRLKSESNDNKRELNDNEVLMKSQEKSARKGNTRRTLRLRRQKYLDNDSSEQERSAKLKDIINLQEEFSDVTMNVPAPKKEVKDIVSPIKIEEEENLPPIEGIQSCPSKSVARSRRKLFTPRAEPLEESLSQVGDSNERVRVPRPSYHRPRARRKL
ncbi:unnamed protein product [Parnassius apollo]|uniref:(apollo) hypothetical protein n=1 Tax=Parnassius apollo TaxID=110799 RepID=A0A8S3WPU1_PARAO|nr:unnamed protein product [Parnassius apollo]